MTPTARIAVATFVGALLVASIWYVQAPPRSAGAYREEATQTAGSLASQLETVALWIETVRDGSAMPQAATIALEEAETDATAAASGFAAHDPPPGTQGLRNDLTGLADRVTSALADVRIDARRGRWNDLGERLHMLATLSRRLEAVTRRVASR